MAKDLIESDYGLMLDDSLLRQDGQYFSSGYNWLLQRNTAYAYSLPILLGSSVGNRDGHASIDTQFKYFTKYWGTKIGLYGTALDIEGNVIDNGTWIVKVFDSTGQIALPFGFEDGSVVREGWFMVELKVTLGFGSVTGTFVASETKKTISIFKREMF